MSADEPERLLGLHVAGDVLDGALLIGGRRPMHSGRTRAGLAAMALAPVIALDVAYWLRARKRAAHRVPAR